MSNPRKAALIVYRVQPDTDANLNAILRAATGAVGQGASLIMLPEAALTGLSNNDDPPHDLPLGREIPGPVVTILGDFCRQHGVWLGIGMLEREGHRLYDSAVLIGPGGEISLKYRRMQPQWHGRRADPSVYCQGSQIGRADTPFGSVAFLICGDLFDDVIVSSLAACWPDLLLFPFARCFPAGTPVQHRWDTQELHAYLGRVKILGVPALMVNYIGDCLPGDNSFGGALAVSAQGELVASLPLMKEGALLVDLGLLGRRLPANCARAGAKAHWVRR